MVKLKAAFQYLKLNDISGKQRWEDKVLSGREFKAAEGLLKCLESVKVVSKMWEADLTPTILLVLGRRSFS